jgi:spore coat polysaccharide biosynthesis predicted glycosyltransferase SpsG
MWEMACMGVPFVPVIIAANQRAAVQAMAGDGYPTIECAAVSSDLPPLLAVLAADPGRRQNLSRIGRNLVDGKGVQRVCAALQDLRGNPAVA